jgi:hypothetical protein
MATLKAKLDRIKQDKKTKIPRSTDEDQQQIAEVDSIRLLALNSIKSALNM